MNGVIKWYAPDRRYGFILAESGIEYFFHFSNVVVTYDPTRLGKNLVEKGEMVQFELGVAPNGKPMATNIVIIKKMDA